ncbi:MAG: DUF1972 domain-containing protein [Actinomycetota bacterium]|nr:DUF1972 domain-containing protein [Actinomycetota bacterium]
MSGPHGGDHLADGVGSRSAAAAVDLPAAPRRSLDIGVFGARAIPSTYSGYETFLTTLLPALVDRGHHVTMYCRTTEVDDGTPYRGVKRVVLPAIAGKQLNTLSHGLVASLRSRLAGHDVVLVVNVANAPYCALNKYTGQRVVLNTDGQEWLRGKWGRAARSYFRFAARMARHGATALVSDCTSMADVYRREFRADSTVIPYCFPTDGSAAPTEAPERLGVVRGDYFIIAGRLNPENNIDVVAEAYSRSELSQPLLVLGTANYSSPVAQTLERLTTSDRRIRLVGHVDDRSEFLDLVGSATCYVHGHSVGGMNPSLVEAMHAGALTVALDTPFNRETLGSAGLFFRTGADGETNVVDVLRDGCEMPLSDAKALRDMAAERVAELYNVEDVVAAYEALLLTSTERSSRSAVVLPTKWSTSP